jgi:Flp pilus assembly protein TadD
MTLSPRAEALRGMLERRPGDHRLLFGLAVELLNGGATEEGVEVLQRYLAEAVDEGNGWARLGAALTELGRLDAAGEAYRRGIQVSMDNGHESLATELEEALAAL